MLLGLNGVGPMSHSLDYEVDMKGLSWGWSWSSGAWYLRMVGMKGMNGLFRGKWPLHLKYSLSGCCPWRLFLSFYLETSLRSFVPHSLFYKPIFFLIISRSQFCHKHPTLALLCVWNILSVCLHVGFLSSRSQLKCYSLKLFVPNCCV